MDRQREPSTKNHKRQAIRGNFGPIGYQDDSIYPKKGTYHVLEQLLQRIQNVPYCSPDMAYNEEDIPQELRDRAEQVPPNERCRVALEYYANQVLVETEEQDHRTRKGAKHNRPVNATFAALPRLERAKVHLNRARQLFAAGMSLVTKGIKENNRIKTRKGKAMIYNTDKHDRRKPRPGKKSALLELYNAYCLIRDFEMNPEPPLVYEESETEESQQDDHLIPNPARVEEEDNYDFLMGTCRMTPNRLGIGFQARQVWRENGIPDYHYYGEHNEEDDNVPTCATLYGQVNSQDNHGPERVESLWFYMYRHREQENPAQPTTAELDRQGFANRKVWTDMSEALHDLHVHFVPPLVLMPDEQDQVIVPTASPPRPLSDAFAPLGRPYTPNTWPFGDHPQQPENYIPVYFPTGVSISEQPSASDACPPYAYTNNPEPLHGLPDNKQYHWDARQSVSKLSTHTKQLYKEATKHAQLKKALLTQLINKQEPNRRIEVEPLTLWEGGKVVPENIDSISIPNISYDTDDQEQAQANNLSPRAYGVDYHVYFPGEHGRIITRETAEQLQVDQYHPFGIETSRVPTRVNVESLPRDRDQQVRLLQHALFLLSAPLNVWQRRNLPESLWLKEPPHESRDAGSPNYGASAPGEGLYMRNNQGNIVSNRKGWRGYYNPFRLDPEGGIRGRAWNQQEDAALQAPERQQDFKTGGVPIGPLLLDPWFGVNDQEHGNHIPRQQYNPTRGIIQVWVIKTNQQTVLGTNTFGKIFYGLLTHCRLGLLLLNVRSIKTIQVNVNIDNISPCQGTLYIQERQHNRKTL